jgi:hypothetical protein
LIEEGGMNMNENKLVAINLKEKKEFQPYPERMVLFEGNVFINRPVTVYKVENKNNINGLDLNPILRAVLQIVAI